MLLCAATLLLKLLVPTGYMIGSAHGRMTIELCSGVASPSMAMPGMHGDMPGHGQPKDHGKAEMPCAFAGLSAVSLAAVDPLQLAALIAFVTGAGRASPAPFTPTRPAHLRPPLRGPPATL